MPVTRGTVGQKYQYAVRASDPDPNDELTFTLTQGPNGSAINPETGVIEDAKFKTFGCGSAIASSSLATEWLRGKTVDEALEIKNTDIVNELSLPPVKIHCSVLAEDAIRAAIGDYKKKAEARSPVSTNA